jgi:hypothetical protein
MKLADDGGLLGLNGGYILADGRKKGRLTPSSKKDNPDSQHIVKKKNFS